MNDRHTKIWLSVFVFTLMAVGGAASFFASEGKTFFKGLEPLKMLEAQGSEMRDELYTSVLNVETENFEQAPEQNSEPQETQEIAAPKISAVSSPCENLETPVIKNGKIAGCGRQEEKKPKLPLPKPEVKIVLQAKPGPKVKILNETQINSPATIASDSSISQFPNFQISISPSCESSGRFTYTGPDRPGLLYGMCIDCETNTFIMNEGCALRAH